MPAFKYRQRWYRRSQVLSQSLSPQMENWLFDASSLTARLIERCGPSFHVKLLSQAYTLMNAEEKAVMGLSHGHAALIRQVLLCDGDTPLVYARTVIPVSTLKGALRRYANLGERPLGAMLFADRTMRRGEVEVTPALPERCCNIKEWSLKELNQAIETKSIIWGRRSVFSVSERPILVSEYFLPTLFETKN